MKPTALLSLAIFYTCFAFSKGKISKVQKGGAEPFRHNVSVAHPMDRSMQPATYYGKNPLGLVKIYAAITSWGPYILYGHGVLVHKNYVMVPSSCVGCRLGWDILWWRISYTVDGYTYYKGVERIYTHPEYDGCWPHQDSVTLLYIGQLSPHYEPETVSKICPVGTDHYSVVSLLDGHEVYTSAALVSRTECSSVWDWIFGSSRGTCVSMTGSCLDKISGMLLISEPAEGVYCSVGLLSEYFLGCLLGYPDVYYEMDRYIEWMSSIIPYD